MTKLFKNSKQIVSLTLALAVLAVSLFTGAVFTASASNGVIYWDGTYTKPETKDGDGNYIIDTAEKLAYIAYASNKSYRTSGESYKVADGIKAIVLQPESLAAIKDKKSASEVKSFFETNAASAESWVVTGKTGKYPFQGTFDGNGATVYGLYANWAAASKPADKYKYAGLFGLVDQGAEIKNISVENSYMTAFKQNDKSYGYVGAIFANSAENSSSWNSSSSDRGDGLIKVYNCSVVNNYIRQASSVAASYQHGGVLVGSAATDYLSVVDCIVYGNDAQNTGLTAADGSKPFNLPLIGSVNDAAAKNSVTNVISLGATPYNKYDFGANVYSDTYFTGVYTDQPTANITMYAANKTADTKFADSAIPGLADITLEGAKGAAGKAALTALDWADTWFANEGLPELQVFHTLTVKDNGDGTHHHYECTDEGCGLVGLDSEHEGLGVSAQCTVCGAALVHTHNTEAYKDNGSSGHQKACSICKEASGDNLPHEYPIGSGGVCACGYKCPHTTVVNEICQACGETIVSTIYWDGTVTEPEYSEQEKAYIIDAVSDLAYLAQANDTGVKSYGYTYKVANGIKSIVLQSQDFADIVNKDSAEEVRAFFEGSAITPAEWKESPYSATNNAFQGTFDGNGATIYGMYNKVGQTSLFGNVDQGLVIKNVSLENCYINSASELVGTLFSLTATNSNNQNGNFGTGNVTIESCVIANNYIRCGVNSSTKTGLIAGWVTADYLQINNILVYGNDAKNTGFTTPFDLPLIASLSGSSGKHNVKNVISLGTTPYNALDFGWAIYRDNDGSMTYTNYFENIYTDQEINSGVLGGNWSSCYSGKNIPNLNKVTADGINGVGAKDALALDWENTWFANNEGIPAIRALHNIANTADATHHYDTCLTCGITGEKEKHDYDANYHCAICGHKCNHTQADGAEILENYPGDCVTAPGYYINCPCGYTLKEPLDGNQDPPGHSFVYHEQQVGDCQENNIPEYWECTVCGNLFRTDDKFAPMSDAVSLLTLKGEGGFGPHDKKTDSTGSILLWNEESGHWFECTVCDGRLDSNNNKIPDNATESHDYDSNGVCTVCGWKSTANEVLYWDGVSYTRPDDADGDGVYEIDAASDIAYLACKTKDNGYETYGKTYKVKYGIKAFVMQPKDSPLAAIKDKTSVDEVKELFEANADTAKWWNVVGYAGAYPFQGTFDGSGATVYGLYGDWASKEDYQKNNYGALFGLVDQGAVIKNIAVKNSYLTTNEGFVGVIFANSASANGTAWNATENNGTGIVTVENCVSANNYLRITSVSNNHRYNAGTLFASSSNDYVKVNNCIVYGNDAKNTGFVTVDAGIGFDLPLFNIKNETDKNDITNVIALGTTPYNKYDFGTNIYKKDSGETGSVFANVYTDQPTENFLMYSDTTLYEDFKNSAMGGLISVTADGIKGAAGIEILSALDWDNVWFANDGLPELRVFHGIDFSDDATGHFYKCRVCGLRGVVEEHTYDAAYKCTVCGHQCTHDQAHGAKQEEVLTENCVHVPGVYITCPCGYSESHPNDPNDVPEGHKLVHTPAFAGDCQNNSIAEYWTCTVCNKIFATNDNMAPMDTDVTIDSLKGDLGTHIKVTDSEGKVVAFSDKTGHWYKCSVCDCKLDADGAEMSKNDVIAHEFDDSFKCKACGWSCSEHEFAATGKILQYGDCDVEQREEIKCGVCGKKDYIVTKHAGHVIVKVEQVDPTDRLEGTKEHYKCETCQQIFGDQEGKTSVDTATLVIPKLQLENLDKLMASVPADTPAEKDTEAKDDNKSDTTSKPQSSTSNQESDIVVYAKNESAKVEGKKGAFSDDTVVKIEKIKDSKDVNVIKKALKKLISKFTAYEITAQSNNVAVQPSSTVTATFAIPKSYNLDRVAVYHISDSGKAEKLKSSVDKTAGIVTAEIEHFSKYAVVELKAESTKADTNAKDNNAASNNIFIWIIIAAAAVLVIGGGVVTFVLIRKAKKNKIA